MLTAEKLRIGNIVDFHGKIETIEVIDLTCVELSKSDRVPLSALGLKPIELTEEWLLKMGFQKKVDFEQQEYEWGIISKANIRRGLGLYNFNGVKELDYWAVTFREDVGCGWVDLNEIKYVNELQNIYHSLFNEELTIK